MEGPESWRQREEELKEVPLQSPDKARWPKGVRDISIDELGCLGIDRQGMLYWNGKPVEVRQRLALSGWQKAGAIIVALAAILGGVGGFVQGLGAGYELGCKRGWALQGCAK